MFGQHCYCQLDAVKYHKVLKIFFFETDEKLFSSRVMLRKCNDCLKGIKIDWVRWYRPRKRSLQSRTEDAQLAKSITISRLCSYIHLRCSIPRHQQIVPFHLISLLTISQHKLAGGGCLFTQNAYQTYGKRFQPFASNARSLLSLLYLQHGGMCVKWMSVHAHTIAGMLCNRMYVELYCRITQPDKNATKDN